MHVSQSIAQRPQTLLNCPPPVVATATLLSSAKEDVGQVQCVHNCQQSPCFRGKSRLRCHFAASSPTEGCCRCHGHWRAAGCAPALWTALLGPDRPTVQRTMVDRFVDAFAAHWKRGPDRTSKLLRGLRLARRRHHGASKAALFFPGRTEMQ